MGRSHPRLRHAVALAAALGALFAVLAAIPGPAHAAEPCRSVAPTGQRALLTPAGGLAQDAAFFPEDPDADDAPLEGIRFPDEAGLWAATAVVDAAAVSRSVQLARDSRLSLGLTGPDRTDRAVSDSIIRLYCGLFDREPDAFDLQYWAGRYWNGLPLVSIADAFSTSGEFVARFGVPNDAALIGILFARVLGRDPGPGAVGPYVGALRSGAMTRGELVVSFTESPEYVALTGTMGPQKPELPYPATGSGRRIIYDNTNNRVYLIEATGELTKTHLVSGRVGIPSAGRYRVYSESRYAWAPFDGITMEYMVRFARGEWPYGFHSIPVWPDERPLQDSAQLGTHRSGGCVRQEFDDAQFVFGWAHVGDRVIVIRPPRTSA